MDTVLMGRRSDHSREQLYDLALDAARRIVETDGLRALTARNVADAIGYSPGTLYNVFANLDDIIAHMNGRTLDHLFDRLQPALTGASPDQDVQALLDGYLGFVADHPRLWSALFDYAMPTDAALPEWYARKIARLLGLAEQALAPLFDDTDTDRPADAARILWASLHGICSLADSDKLQVVTTQSARQMAEGLVTNFLAGVRARAGGGVS